MVFVRDLESFGHHSNGVGWVLDRVDAPASLPLISNGVQYGRALVRMALRRPQAARHHYRRLLMQDWHASVAVAPLVWWADITHRLDLSYLRAHASHILRLFLNDLLDVVIHSPHSRMLGLYGAAFLESLLPPYPPTQRHLQGALHAFTDSDWLENDVMRRLDTARFEVPSNTIITLGALAFTLTAYARPVTLKNHYNRFFEWVFRAHNSPGAAIYQLATDGVYVRADTSEFRYVLEGAARMLELCLRQQSRSSPPEWKILEAYQSADRLFREMPKGDYPQALREWRSWFNERAGVEWYNAHAQRSNDSGG